MPGKLLLMSRSPVGIPGVLLMSRSPVGIPEVLLMSRSPVGREEALRRVCTVLPEVCRETL